MTTKNVNGRKRSRDSTERTATQQRQPHKAPQQQQLTSFVFSSSPFDRSDFFAQKRGALQQLNGLLKRLETEIKPAYEISSCGDETCVSLALMADRPSYFAALTRLMESVAAVTKKTAQSVEGCIRHWTHSSQSRGVRRGLRTTAAHILRMRCS